MKETNNENDDPMQRMNELFKFQNLSSDEYRVLDSIIDNYRQSGLMIAVCEAYFWGTVNGKRLERKRNKIE